MTKRQISNLDLKIKYTLEFIKNGGKVPDIELIEDLERVVNGPDDKVNTDSISPRVNAFMGAIFISHTMPPVFMPERISEYASLLQKSNSFDQKNIDTPEQFNEVYAEMKEKKNTLFRGQREAKWRLYSSLQRHWISKKLFESAKSYQELLEQLVANGKTEYDEHIKELLAEHHIDSQNDIAVLGYLQHHGCPTPLLDWTFKFQNALYFGMDGLIPNPSSREIEEYFSVYYIKEQHFEDSNMRTIIDSGLKEIGEQELQHWIEMIAKDKVQEKEMKEHFAGRSFFDSKKITGSGLIKHMTKIESIIGFPVSYFSDRDVDSDILFSLKNSKNIQNQDGVFTWNADPSKPLEMVGDEMYKETYPDTDGSEYYFCSCFNIHKSLEPYIREKLNADGITKDYIYPTTDINAWGVFEKSLT